MKRLYTYIKNLFISTSEKKDVIVEDIKEDIQHNKVESIKEDIEEKLETVTEELNIVVEEVKERVGEVVEEVFVHTGNKPKLKDKKCVIISYLEENGIEYDKTDTKSKLLEKIK